MGKRKKKDKKFYLVIAMKTEHNINLKSLRLGFDEATISMCWAEGMVGAVPVFDNKKDAQKYAGDSGVQIFELDAVKNKVKEEK